MDQPTSAATQQRTRDLCALLGFTLLMTGIGLFDYRVALIISGVGILSAALYGTLKRTE